MLVSLAILIITNIDKKNRIDSHLRNATHTFTTQYKTIYNSYMNISKASHSIIFDSPIVTGHLIDSQSSNPIDIKAARINLYNLLKNKYKKLTELGLEQLHFHTKDNRSFLRMHKPEQYGDDLTDVRYSVNYVNQNKKFIHGLEAGRIGHGFRFVYPMYNENFYLGSVEYSISSNAFIESIESAFHTDVHFIVDKEVIYSKIFEIHKTSYEQSVESKNYLRLKEKAHDNYGMSHIPKKILEEKLSSKIEENLKKDNAFSLYTKYDGEFMVLTFLPLKNIKEKKKVAYLVSYTKNKNIEDIYVDFIEINVILELLTILILYFFYLLNSNKQKLLNEQKILSENTKLDSMRDMIANIAHHWRQPLSVISTSSSGMLVQNELGILKPDYLDKNLKSIIDTTKALSNTIDEFRDFMINENEQSQFTIKEMIDKVLIITESSIHNNQITLIQDNNSNATITSVQNILVDSLVKILTNSIEVLKKVDKEDDRIIFFTVEKTSSSLIIRVKDTGAGIDDTIINNIFEPYFTTKHQSMGTGLGLYTVQANITNVLKGSVTVKNSTFTHNSKNYTGALFNIIIPI